jgi:hypothetical protein
MESNLDKEKINSLNSLKNKLLGTEVETTSNPNFPTQTKLIEHANFNHDFTNVNKPDLIKSFLLKDTEFDQNKIGIITNVKKRDLNTLEISKQFIFKDFYNNEPFANEKIIIKRDGSNDLLISFYEDKFKKVGTYITPEGNFSSLAKFKNFRNAEEVLFKQNIFYYFSILEINKIYRLLGKTPVKKEMEINKLYYYEYLKNLF